MFAYYLQQHDGDARLLLREDLSRPEPGPDQLLVRVRAAGLNRGEFLSAPSAQPRPLGMEAAGEVVDMGSAVRGWRVGDRVMGRCSGGFADFALLNDRESLPVPAGMHWTDAGALPITFMVVYDMLVLQGRLQAGETLLVAGISSGVGVAALLAARALGARVIGTSGSAAKLERLKVLGLDLGIVARGPDFAAAVRSATAERGADLAINAIGGSVFAECVRALAFQGRLAMVGHVDGQMHAELDLQALHGKRLHLFGVSSKLRTPEQRAEPAIGLRADWLPLFADGRLKPLVDRVFAFEKLAEAKTAMENGEHLGKIVLAGSADA